MHASQVSAHRKLMQATSRRSFHAEAQSRDAEVVITATASRGAEDLARPRRHDRLNADPKSSCFKVVDGEEGCATTRARPGVQSSAPLRTSAPLRENTLRDGFAKNTLR